MLQTNEVFFYLLTMKIEELYPLYAQHFLVDTDTRKIRKNTLFFALKGERFNGNTFAKKALEAGASYSIVDEEIYATHPAILLVDNVLETLQQLAHYHRNQLGIPIIGLTGSNGKTTTKELIKAVISKKFKTVATAGNFNNHIGVPLTLLSMHPDTEIGIVEMGANHQKEIEFLSEICAPNFGYITNFGKAHLEGFGGVAGVIKGKTELYSYLRENEKTAFVNPNDALQVEKTSQMHRVFFEESLQLQSADPFLRLSCQNTLIESNLIGKYNFDNICAAVTIGTYFKVPLPDIKNAIEGYFPDNNRSQIIEKASNKIILDAYNANPTSMRAALESFQIMEAEHKVLILGDMFELGASEIEEHQQIANFLWEANFKSVLLVGKLFHQVQTTYPQFKTFEDLKNHLKTDQPSNSHILIKGSRGMQLERVLDLLN